MDGYISFVRDIDFEGEDNDQQVTFVGTYSYQNGQYVAKSSVLFQPNAAASWGPSPASGPVSQEQALQGLSSQLESTAVCLWIPACFSLLTWWCWSHA